MKIERVALRNFRQYREEEIEFAYAQKDKGLTVIQGANGAGKTNLLNAITWCIYGEEKHLGEKYKGLPLINTSTMAEVDEGTVREVQVEIHMRDRENKMILVSRTVGFRKCDGGRVEKTPSSLANMPDGSYFFVARQIGKDMKMDRDPEYTLGRFIPAAIEEYFFFDGERLDEYFREESGESIRTAVFRISQVAVMRRAIEHLKNVRSHVLKRQRDFSPEADRIRGEMEECARELDENKRELQELIARRGEARRKKQEFASKLRGGSPSRIAQLDTEREELQIDLKKLEESRRELERERFDYLARMAPLVFGHRAITATRDQIDKRKEAGDVPPQYRKGFVERLLRTGRCICGTDISKDSECRQKVQTMLEECDSLSEMSGELMEEHAILRSILDDLEGFRQRQKDYGKRVKELEQRLTEKSNRLEQITEEIGDVNVEKIRLWEHKRAEYESLEADFSERIGRTKCRVQQEEARLESLNGRLKKELEKEERHRSLRDTLDFCDEAVVEAEKTRDSIMEDVRREIEEKTKKQFFDLMWKRRTYEDVTIDTNYNISVKHRSGMEGIGTLSAGERQMLALSFMAALNMISGFDAPIIIDTPLGRLSRVTKENLASNLLNYLQAKQICLLVTDEEYSPQVRMKLSPRIGREYKIEFTEMEQGGEAKVVAYE